MLLGSKPEETAKDLLLIYQVFEKFEQLLQQPSQKKPPSEEDEKGIKKKP
jgi:hypothetical protein